jgi:alpha 1,2-mannosyltransferase
MVCYPPVPLPWHADKLTHSPTPSPFPPCTDFMTEHPEYVVQNNAMNFLSDNGGIDYNLCHCMSFSRNIIKGACPTDHRHCQKLKTVWSNFEIADMDFWRGEAYSAFFEYLDSHGGFYYEVTSSLQPSLSNQRLTKKTVRIEQRWGDAPVHSIAAALFAGTDRIHFFREIGYEHAPFMHCPAETEIWERGQCACDSQHSFGKCKILSEPLVPRHFRLPLMRPPFLFRL